MTNEEKIKDQEQQIKSVRFWALIQYLFNVLLCAALKEYSNEQ